MSSTRSSQDRVELAVCAILRDEASYLAEWVAFHHLQGVERFRLYDNGSTDHPEDVLRPWIDRGLVDLRPWPHAFTDGAQERAYRDALAGLRGRSRWVAFIDADEFLHSPVGDPLPQVLGDHRDAAGVGVRWQVYGTSGQVQRADGLVIERCRYRAPVPWVRNRRIKCVVDPDRVDGPVGPHWFTPRHGAAIVDEDHRPLAQHPVGDRRVRLREAVATIAPRAPVDPYARRDLTPPDVRVARLRINHYPLKSREEYAAKRARFATDGRRTSQERRYDRRYFTYHDRNDVHDPMPQRVVDAVSGELRATA